MDSTSNSRIEKWGFLREDDIKAKKAGIDYATGLHRTGLNEYLKVIYPHVNDWEHDKPIGRTLDGQLIRYRPDYRSEALKLIVEFDGVQHYSNPEVILHDFDKKKTYERLGYKLVAIPYFIQLTNKAVEQLFGVKVQEQLFNGKYPSPRVGCSPAYLCPAGISRMVNEFCAFPDQYKVNFVYLKSLNNEFLSGVNILEEQYLNCKQRQHKMP